MGFSLIGNAPAPVIDLRTPVFQLSWLRSYWWKYWNIISDIWSQCPRLDGRESGTSLWVMWHVDSSFADSQGAGCLEDLLQLTWCSEIGPPGLISIAFSFSSEML